MPSTNKKQFRIQKKYKQSLLAHQDLIISTARLMLQRQDLLQSHLQNKAEQDLTTVIYLKLSDEGLQVIEQLKHLMQSLTERKISNRQAIEAIACQLLSIYGKTYENH